MQDADRIENRGFLSVEIEKYRKVYKATYKNLFSVCEQKSDSVTTRLFQANLSKFEGANEPHIVVAIGLWLRCVRACQASLLLLERGLVPEAQALIRSAYEFLFYAVAVLRDPDIVDSMWEGDSYARKEQAESMLRQGREVGALDEEQTEKLTSLIAQLEKGKKQISSYDAAKKAGMTYLYATVYRGMSFVGTHATLAATNLMFEPTGEHVSAVFGPSDANLPFSVGLVDRCLAEGAEHFDSLLRGGG